MSKEQRSVGNWVMKPTLTFITQAGISIFWSAAVWGGAIAPSPPVDPPLSLNQNEVKHPNTVKIMLEHCTNNYHKNFFIQRVAPVWNSLPLAIVDFSSLPRFKRSLALVNLRIFTCF